MKIGKRIYFLIFIKCYKLFKLIDYCTVQVFTFWITCNTVIIYCSLLSNLKTLVVYHTLVVYFSHFC